MIIKGKNAVRGILCANVFGRQMCLGMFLIFVLSLPAIRFVQLESVHGTGNGTLQLELANGNEMEMAMGMDLGIEMELGSANGNGCDVFLKKSYHEVKYVKS